MPLRSLKRSSDCGGPAFGARGEIAEATTGAAEFAGATEASDEEFPHNSCTAGETGCARSPAWNSERNTGAAGGEVLVVVDAEAIVTGTTDRVSGKLDRKVAVSATDELGVLLATATLGLISPPTDAIALWVADEVAALS